MSSDARARVNTNNLENYNYSMPLLLFLFSFVVTIKSLSKTFDIKIPFGKAFTDCGNSYGHLGCSSGSINAPVNILPVRGGRRADPGEFDILKYLESKSPP